MAFEGVARRMEREHDERMHHAWHVAALTRAKKLPPLRRLLGRKRRKPKPQSWQQQFAIAQMIAAAYGEPEKKR